MEKQSFFYKEIQKGKNTQRIDLQEAFTNALLGDVKLDSPIQSRQIKIK